MFGVIADDLTGATDAACMMARHGMSVTQIIGVPTRPLKEECDAVVIALKTRSSPVEEAVAQSLASLSWLQENGADQYYQKYCSTFDSTPRGNIGPVANALSDALGQMTTVFCPAFPENGRTVYQGHMFVGGRLISESSLASHPLTPMTDPDLVRVLAAQSNGVKVVSVPFEDLQQGVSHTSRCLESLEDDAKWFVLADALTDDHILTWARVLKSTQFVTGGSPLCGGLTFLRGSSTRKVRGNIAPRDADGPRVVLSGSCSEATRRQLKRLQTSHNILQIDPLQLGHGQSHLSQLIAEASETFRAGRSVIVASTAPPDIVAQAQEKFGLEALATLVESALGHVAVALAENGARTFIVAGGETSSAVANALNIERLAIGDEIAPGVPWTQSLDEPQYRLTFKSGNFGSDSFFLEALGGSAGVQA